MTHTKMQIATQIWLFKCSKTIRKKKNFFSKKNMYNFKKTLIISVKFFFFLIKLFIQNKYLYPLSKKLNLLKKINSVKIFILFKQTHPVKDEFYFQFSFATNEQV